MMPLNLTDECIETFSSSRTSYHAEAYFSGVPRVGLSMPSTSRIKRSQRYALLLSVLIAV